MLPTVESTDRALSAALLMVAIAPTAEAHRAVADRYRVLRIPDMAYDHYLRASQIDRTDAAAYEGLARVWRDWGFPQLGVADASRAVYYAPASASAHNTWARSSPPSDTAATRGGSTSAPSPSIPAPPTPGTTSVTCRSSTANASGALTECRAALSLDPAMTAARDTLAVLERQDAPERMP